MDADDGRHTVLGGLEGTLQGRLELRGIVYVFPVAAERLGNVIVTGLRRLTGTPLAILRSERADKLLDAWLEEAKSRTATEFKPEAFE